MTQDNPDIYSAIAIKGEGGFELLGRDVATSLHFAPVAAFLLTTVLHNEEPFTANSIVKTREFEQVCGEVSPQTLFLKVFSHLQFTLDALGSTLIKHERGHSGVAHLYQRNPDYKIIGLIKGTSH